MIPFSTWMRYFTSVLCLSTENWTVFHFYQLHLLIFGVTSTVEDYSDERRKEILIPIRIWYFLGRSSRYFTTKFITMIHRSFNRMWQRSTKTICLYRKAFFHILTSETFSIFSWVESDLSKETKIKRGSFFLYQIGLAFAHGKNDVEKRISIIFLFLSLLNAQADKERLSKIVSPLNSKKVDQ